MESFDQIEGSLTLNDVIYRRLKNRERQRRYRERKRLKAVSSKPSVSNQSSQLQIIPISLPTNGILEQVTTRVHCVRDWKKEARRLHASKQETINNALSSNDQSSPFEGRPSAIQEAEQISKTGSCLDDHEKARLKARRRDWKAEARKNRLSILGNGFH